MIDIEDLKRKAQAAVGPHRSGYDAQCKTEDFNDSVFPETVLALIERLEAAERDAARYCWLRENVHSGTVGCQDGWLDFGCFDDIEADIDAELAKVPK